MTEIGTPIETVIAVILPIILIALFISLVVTIIIVVSTWRLFKEAGEDGWKSIIPIYNVYVMIKIAFDGQYWLMSGLALSFIGGAVGMSSPIGLLLVVFGYAMNIYIKFGFIRRFADVGMAVTAIFFPMIVYPIVAFSKKYTVELSDDYDMFL